MFVTGKYTSSLFLKHHMEMAKIIPKMMDFHLFYCIGT